MANLRNDLKVFARRDGSGRIIEGSMVRRKKMPTVGRWVEITVPDCCAPSTTTTTTTDNR